MSRLFVPLARRTFRAVIAVKNVNNGLTFARPVFQATSVQVRTFSADHHDSHASGHGHVEPFLDVKEVTDRIIEVVKNFEKVNASKVSAGARFKEDLDLDSLDAVEVVMAIEEEFAIEIPDSEADKILSIADAVAYVSTHPMAK